jgi:hypothetical protein
MLRWVVLVALLAVCGACGDDSTPSADSTPPPKSGEMHVTIDDERSNEDAQCTDQPTAVSVVNYFGEPVRGEPSIAIQLHFTDDSRDEVRAVDGTIEDVDDGFAYIEDIKVTGFSDGGLSGSVEGSGLLKENSEVDPHSIAISWRCD